MIDEEAVRQWRDVTGETVLICEHCGRAIEPGHAHRIAPSDRDTSGAADIVTACDDCWTLIERGEFEAFPAEEVEPE